jgi:hypothetical protein
MGLGRRYDLPVGASIWRHAVATCNLLNLTRARRRWRRRRTLGGLGTEPEMDGIGPVQYSHDD